MSHCGLLSSLLLLWCGLCVSDVKVMPLLVWLVLGLSGVHCDFHALRCYETVVSSPGSGLPLYSVAVYVDDKIVLDYSSDTRQYLPKVEWIKKLDAEYLARESRRSRINQDILTDILQTLAVRFNQTKGFHFYQWMYGCELTDDGQSSTFMQYGYDGRDFMYLDTHSGSFIPAMNEAQLTTQRWNSPDMRMGVRNKNELQNECLDYLTKFIIYGREELEKQVPPEVKVWGRRSDRVVRLYCLVYGFHPRGVDVRWMRNGTEHIMSDEASPILPHPDGTYQTRVSVEVPTGERDSYSCHVDHSSLEEPLVFIWDGTTEAKNLSLVLAGVAGVGMLLSVVGVVYFLYRTCSGISY